MRANQSKSRRGDRSRSLLTSGVTSSPLSSLDAKVEKLINAVIVVSCGGPYLHTTNVLRCRHLTNTKGFVSQYFTSKGSEIYDAFLPE